MVFDDSVLPVIEAGQARAVPDAGEEILDGIRFLPTFGHSIGHMAMEIRSRGETALFSGDVMHSAVQVHRPEWNSMFCLDQEQARASRERLLAHAADTGATVFAAHFAETSAGTVRRVGEVLNGAMRERRKASVPRSSSWIQHA
jgi:glyoxylase-like metal-dependent hydrolase (beta-lactamase superfamily II)